MWETSSMANAMTPAFAVVLRMMACRPISTSLESRGVGQHRTRVVVPADEPHLEAAGHDDLTDRALGAQGRVEGVWVCSVG
ncbi:hypothetical protein JO379_000324 [Streptomyces syringium]|uniref:Secreted protein n=1 Tax=Streptomyces syringium TaxID=76729 RepID=A0ABS4XWG0_9ACTN|nr:hypothetical protein [Streptomyces syringium]